MLAAGVNGIAQVPPTLDRAYVRPSFADASARGKAAQGSEPAAEPYDVVAISPQARQLSRAQAAGESQSAPAESAGSEEKLNSTSSANLSAERDTAGQPLSRQEEREVEELRQRDREVRAHELAHKTGLGQYANGGPTYQFTVGPDGRRYAVGGSVSVDLSEEGNPERTIQKAQTIRRAAMAPANPSGQDRQIAAQASQMEREARQEIIAEDQRERAEARDKTSSQPSPAAPSAARIASPADGITASSKDSKTAPTQAASGGSGPTVAALDR